MTDNNNERLQVGAASVDITPPADCLLDGFAARDHGCVGIHDNLYADAVALSRRGKTAVILGLDLLGLTVDQIDFIWAETERRFGLKPEQLFINCSHTHAGPLIRPRYNSKFCSCGQVCLPDAVYCDFLLDRIIAVIGSALEAREPASAQWALGTTNIGIYRRAKDVGIYTGDFARRHRIFENFPNPDKEIDRTCPVLLFADDQQKPLALIFGASCHPTTMSYDNYQVSAEYPGVAKHIVREYIGGAVTLFLQGRGGDVKPLRVADGDRFRSGTFGDVGAVGAELASDVIRTADTLLQPLDIHLKTALKRFPLPLAGGWDEKTYRVMAAENESEYRRVWAQHWLDRIENGETPPTSRDITLSVMELSPELRFLGVAGELLTDMGMKIGSRFTEGTTLPMGYTNGRIGYIPDSRVMKEGGYEPVETIYFTNDMPAPWREDIETILVDSFDELKRRLA